MNSDKWTVNSDKVWWLEHGWDGLNRWTQIRGIITNYKLRITNGGLGTRNMKRGTRDSELGTRNSEHETRDSELGIRNWGVGIRRSEGRGQRTEDGGQRLIFVIRWIISNQTTKNRKTKITKKQNHILTPRRSLSIVELQRCWILGVSFFIIELNDQTIVTQKH